MTKRELKKKFEGWPARLIKKVKKPNLKFEAAICVKSGMYRDAEYGDHEFLEGEIYPILGMNNGIQICYNDGGKKGGDAIIMMCYTTGVNGGIGFIPYTRSGDPEAPEFQEFAIMTRPSWIIG